MLHLTLSEGGATRSCVAETFPFTIGRAPGSGLRISAPGAWDCHATIEVRDGRFHVEPQGEALLLVNDEPCRGGLLKMGDRISLGAARVTVSLSPPPQKGLAARESVVWAAIGALAVVQLLMIAALR
jgi:predicted component of type VI protein secretion system